MAMEAAFDVVPGTFWVKERNGMEGEGRDRREEERKGKRRRGKRRGL